MTKKELQERPHTSPPANIPAQTVTLALHTATWLSASTGSEAAAGPSEPGKTPALHTTTHLLHTRCHYLSRHLRQTESAALILAILIIYILFDLILETTKDILWTNSHSIIYLGE